MILTAFNTNDKSGFVLTNKNSVAIASRGRFLKEGWVITNNVNLFDQSQTSLKTVVHLSQGDNAVLKGAEFIDDYSVKLYSQNKDDNRALSVIHLTKANVWRIQSTDTIAYVLKSAMSFEEVCNEFRGWNLQHPISSTMHMMHAKEIFTRVKYLLWEQRDLDSIHSKAVIGFEIEKVSNTAANITVMYKHPRSFLLSKEVFTTSHENDTLSIVHST